MQAKNLTFRSTLCFSLHTVTLRWPKYVLLFLLLFGLETSLSAQSLEIDVTVDKANVLTCEPISYTLSYRCASTTLHCPDVTMTASVPSGVLFPTNQDFSNNTHIQSAMYSTDRRMITFTFVNPLPAGSTGTITLNGIGECGLPEGTVATLTGSIVSGTGTPITDAVNTTLHSTVKFCPVKHPGSGLSLDNPTTYKIDLVPAGIYGSQGIGTTNLINVSMVDNLPPNTIINSVTPTYTTGGSYSNFPPGTCTIDNTPSAPKVNCTFPDVAFTQTSNIGSWAVIYVDVTYPDASFNAGNNVTNSVTVNYTPLGGTPQVAQEGVIVNYNLGTTYGNTTPSTCTMDLDVTDVLEDPNPEGDIYKRAAGTTIKPGEVVEFLIDISNTGNTPLTNVEVVDTIPAEFDVVNIVRSGTLVGFITQPVISYYIKTVANPTYTLVVFPGGGYTYTVPSGDEITHVKIVVDQMPPDSRIQYARINVRLKDGITSGSIQNCAYHTANELPTEATPGNNCWTLTVLPPDNFSTIQINKALGPNPGGISQSYYSTQVSTGGIVWNNFEATNLNGGQLLQNAVIADLLPVGLTYDNFIQYSGTCVPDPSNVEIITNFQGSGRTLVRLTWTTPWPNGCTKIISVRTKLNNLATGGYITGQLDPVFANQYNMPFEALPYSEKNSVFFTGSNATKCKIQNQYNPYNNYASPDLLDVDSDGITTLDTLCFSSAFVNVASQAQMESVKWVMGQLDSGYSRYPQTGKTVQGGLADYRLVVKNEGNVPMTDVVVIDILPFIGDGGVIDLSARNTMWRPNLANPIIAPAGVTVYYSTAQNPCRDEVKLPSDPSPFPTGCTPANWTLAPLPDITSVQSLKFDFGSIILGPQDSLVLTWPMRAPTDAPTNGEIAWNSFGYVATRTDNGQTLLPAEPIKVGIEVYEANPGVYGDYVWIDTNMDGFQNEVGTGVSGVVVEFYRDNGDGISNPLTDVLVSYTVTDANGRYLFPDLIPGDYYAVFYPPAGYVVTLTNQGGNDSIDSDGLIMPVTHIDAGEDDRTWDLGLFLSPNCDVNISFVSVSPCYWDGTSSQVVVNAYVTWANAPAGQDIEVSLNGQTQTIDVSGGAQQMAFVTFTIPSDNTLYTINACFTGGSNCCESRTLKPHLPCNPNQCYLDIVNTYTGSCDGTNYILDVEVNWSVPPAGEDIIVTAGGQTQTINVSGGITPPVCAVFTLPANGMTGLPVTASFETTTSCSDSDTFNSPTCVLCNLATQCNPSPQTSCTPVNGSATVTVTGGQGNITYIWSSGETTSSISSKAAGTYTVTVTDDFVPGCTSTCQAIITSSTTLPTATCAKTDNTNCASPNGTATVTTNANQILWSNAATTASISGLSGGTYTVTVTNTTTGCTNTCQSVVANATVNPTCNITANTQPSCANLTGGSITVNPSPAGTYTYNWSDIGSGGANRTGLSGGTYTVTVTNTTSSCTGVCQVTLTTPTNCCNINAIVPQNIICYDNGTPGLNTDNRIRFNANVTNTNTSLTSYNVAINGGTTITPNTNVPYGPMLFTLGPGTAGGGATFTVTVTDSATPGCTQTFQIVDPGNCDPGGPGDECPTPKCGTATIQANGN